MEVRQGSAADVEAVLGLLKAIGLVGPKMALQVGEEEVVAAQVAERLALEDDGWLTSLIKAQVESAVDALAWGARLDGEKMTPGQQNIRDAVDFAVWGRRKPNKSLRQRVRCQQ